MQIGGQAVTVTSLGRYCAQGNSLSHELRLIQRSNNGLIASATVSMSGCTEGQTKYATLASPVTLSPNTAYVLVSYEVGADKFHDYNGTTLTTTSVATVVHGIYTTDGGQTWGAAGSTGNSYVPVDFQYITGGTAEISYLVSDQLGTPRMVFDQSGDLATTKRHDYAPFGEELFNGARTTAMGYAAGDLTRQKFTQKERDNETGLDFFEARYYASTQGRFTSADPLQASAKRRNPQTWNRYTYGLNNPLRFTDPDGEDSEDESGDVYLRTKIKTTEVTVQERGGGQIVREAKITITESQTDYVGSNGTVIQSDPTQTSATAVNTGNGVLNYSEDQTTKMATAAQAIVEVSRDKGFDATIALGIAQTETHMTTLKSQESSPAKQTDINPMQLSGTSGIKPTTDLKSNIAGAIDVYNRGSTSDLRQSLETYNNQAGKAAYATTAMGNINNIRGSVQTRTVTNNLSQRPARFGFPTRPQ
jgi:RHS repeat-associated protein